MHINTINSLFGDMGIDVDSKGLDFENVPDIYQDVEVEKSMNQCLANLHIEENCVFNLNDT
jgi:hypothetical protein